MWAFMGTIDESTRRTTARYLAVQMGVTPASIRGHVNRAVKLKLARRVDQMHDQAGVYILTSAGRESLASGVAHRPTDERPTLGRALYGAACVVLGIDPSADGSDSAVAQLGGIEPSAVGSWRRGHHNPMTGGASAFARRVGLRLAFTPDTGWHAAPLGGEQ